MGEEPERAAVDRLSVGSSDPLILHGVFSSFIPRARQILTGIGSTPESEMVESLATDIDETKLEGIRNSLFEAAKPMIASIFPDNIVTDFEMIRRKMPAKCIALAKDIIKISVFVCGMKTVFPIEVISKPNTYVELCKKKSEVDGGHTASALNVSRDVAND